jgi:hypothetical protein
MLCARTQTPYVHAHAPPALPRRFPLASTPLRSFVSSPFSRLFNTTAHQGKRQEYSQHSIKVLEQRRTQWEAAVNLSFSLNETDPLVEVALHGERGRSRRRRGRGSRESTAGSEEWRVEAARADRETA